MIWGNETLAADVLVVSRRDTFHEHTGVAHHAVEQPVRAHPSLVEHSLGEGEVLVRYPRLLAAAWRSSADKVMNLLSEHVDNAFGVRTLGYYCLGRPENPAMALRVAWELSRAEEYDLAIRLYKELKESG
jgi:hypothetical protein